MLFNKEHIFAIVLYVDLLFTKMRNGQSYELGFFFSKCGVGSKFEVFGWDFMWDGTIGQKLELKMWVLLPLK